MNTTTNIGGNAAGTPSDVKVQTGRVVRFASRRQIKKAGAWAIKKYSETFKKLAE